MLFFWNARFFPFQNQHFKIHPVLRDRFWRAWKRCIQRVHNSKKKSKTFLRSLILQTYSITQFIFYTNETSPKTIRSPTSATFASVNINHHKNESNSTSTLLGLRKSLYKNSTSKTFRFTLLKIKKNKIEESEIPNRPIVLNANLFHGHSFFGCDNLTSDWPCNSHFKIFQKFYFKSRTDSYQIQVYKPSGRPLGLWIWIKRKRNAQNRSSSRK